MDLIVGETGAKNVYQMIGCVYALCFFYELWINPYEPDMTR